MKILLATLVFCMAALAQTAVFVKTDTTTRGNWKSVYGADGYNIINNSASNPSYAAPNPVVGYSSSTWVASTSDPRALQKATNLVDRIASSWYASQFTVNLGITDSNTHQVALYLLDWDTTNRRQTITVQSMAGTVLDAQALTTSFNSGVYLVWNISGNVRFQFTQTAGYNAVLSGIFFDTFGSSPPPPPPPPTPPPPSSVSIPIVSSFTNQATVTMTHPWGASWQAMNILVSKMSGLVDLRCYDNTPQWNILLPKSVAVTSSASLTVTFPTAVSGTCVVK